MNDSNKCLQVNLKNFSWIASLQVASPFLTDLMSPLPLWPLSRRGCDCIQWTNLFIKTFEVLNLPYRLFTIGGKYAHSAILDDCQTFLTCSAKFTSYHVERTHIKFVASLFSLLCRKLTCFVWRSFIFRMEEGFYIENTNRFFKYKTLLPFWSSFCHFCHWRHIYLW